ncbi:MAG: hypothetical protein L0332_07215 [Chloroflexi bacterium]|nr:hypothetical protein [Chloroflexota bacterium]MCI0574748.1 hypothetical protein [Chloroflexota bacterium]MCI0645683.1 hypothetical protein [Chloroflexota bacterium]MCI0726499.1 hypothetical protein [Chloroflexota bacterium]
MKKLTAYSWQLFTEKVYCIFNEHFSTFTTDPEQRFQDNYPAVEPDHPGHASVLQWWIAVQPIATCGLKEYNPAQDSNSEL